jgi:hypothetical protein
MKRNDRRVLPISSYGYDIVDFQKCQHKKVLERCYPSVVMV